MGNKERNDVYNKCIKKLEELGFEPKVSKSTLNKWVNGEKTDFGDSLCISNIDNKKASKACAEVNKVIKPHGGRLKADNYNTAFLSVKESASINEDASLVLSASFLLFMAAIANADKVSAIAKKVTGGKYNYIASDKKTNSISPSTIGWDNEKKATAAFAYISLNLKNIDNNALVLDTNDKDKLKQKFYIYKYNDKNTKLVFSGTIDEACKKYGIKYKQLDLDKLKVRKKLYKDTVARFKSLISSEKKLCSKGTFGEDDEFEVEDFLSGENDWITIYYCDLWDLVPNARNASNEEFDAIYKPLEKAAKEIEKSLPAGYSISRDGDWDDVHYTLEAPACVKESSDVDENFLNRNSKPVKNAKAHYTFLKKKQAANKTNGATGQSEMPKYNTISTSASGVVSKEDDDVLTEAEIQLLYEASSKDMKPIFIVTSYTNTAFGKVITTYTHSTYSHASLSFDSSLEKLYSFNANNNQNKLGGLSYESISAYIKQYKDTRICVSCIFVKNDDYDKIMKALDKMMENKSFTKYGYGNILNIILNRTKDMGNDAMTMVCSQFVAYLLSRADIHITDKSANLTTPNDLSNIANPRVYKLYEGLAREYDQKAIDRIFRKLKRRAEVIKEYFQI